MDNNFVFDDNDSKKGILKWVLIISAIVLGLAGILSILIGSALIGKADACKTVSEQTSIDRCENPFQQVIFVVGNTANTPTPTLNEGNSKIISALYDIDKKGKTGLSYISVANPDDSPQSFNINKKGSEKISEAVVKQISSSVADVDGADYLEAIRNAAGHAKNKEDTLIYVIGSGLSDSGLLNFANDDLLKLDTDEVKKSVLSAIEDKDELDGITIFWEGIGDTVSPQKALTTQLKNKEKKIYEAVLKGIGLDAYNLIFSNPSSENNEVNSRVTTSVKTTPADASIAVIYSSDDSALAFNPSSDTFKNYNAAKDEIAKLTEQNRNATFAIQAFMSRGICNASKDDNLLRHRAEATKNLLMSVGHVSESNITIEDGEIGDANECPNGPGNYPVVETEAAKNRKVVINVLK